MNWTSVRRLTARDVGTAMDLLAPRARKHLVLETFPCKLIEGTAERKDGIVFGSAFSYADHICSDKRFDSSDKLSVHRKGPDYRSCDLC